MALREDFENWSYGWDLDFTLFSESPATYIHRPTQIAYEAYQARQPEIDALKAQLMDLVVINGAWETAEVLASKVYILQQENAALKAENEKLRKDAERYRYLRNRACTSFVWDWESECGLIKDNNIDAAMTASPDTKGE